MLKLSVIICTYNPYIPILNKVLKALKSQTLNQQYWQLIIVDNNSEPPVSKVLNIDWHINGFITEEKELGLIKARITGYKLSGDTPVIIFVDDDNVLDPNYLHNSLQFSYKHPEVGCFGGKSIPIYETPPPSWFFKTNISLGCQDYGDKLFISNYNLKKLKLLKYPERAPIGTGMVITSKSFLCYLQAIENDIKRLQLGRKGLNLISGEDNDIVLTVIKHGYEIACIPELIVNHHIQKRRYNLEYLKKIAFQSNQSWIKALEIHDINPWKKIPKWTVPIRCLKAWILYKGWKNEANYINWKSACGTFQGLSEI